MLWRADTNLIDHKTLSSKVILSSHCSTEEKTEGLGPDPTPEGQRSLATQTA